MRLLKAFLHDTSGATALEYAIIGSLIGIVILASVQSIGQNVSSQFSKAAGGFSSR